MAGPFQPRFVDLVRNLTSTAGTENFVLGDTPTGFRGFAGSLQPGDNFYYTAVGLEKPGETEVGRGTLQPDGSIARKATTGALTNFSAGIKMVSLVAGAEWFDRVHNRGWLSLTDMGGVADCTDVGAGTDNSPAFNAAIAKLAAAGGGTLFIPRGRYRFRSRPVLTDGVIIQGEGYHGNPGFVAGSTYSGIYVYDGTILVFDADTAGPVLLEFCGDGDASAVAADLAANSTGSTYLKYKSARGSVVRDLMLYGGGGTAVTAHGLESRTVVHVENVAAINFAGCGFRINASTSGAGVPYGNASGSRFLGCSARANRMHGFQVSGIDANVMMFETCDSANNGGAGYLDDGFLGNSYISCHAATNNGSAGSNDAARTQILADAPLLADQYVGSFYSTRVNPPHIFIGCYNEGGLGGLAHLLSPCSIYGGLLGSLGSLTPTSTAVVLNGGAISNLNYLKPMSGSLVVSHLSGGSVDLSTNGVSTLRMQPGTGLYSNIKMNGNDNNISLGLDIVAGAGGAYLSSNLFMLRNAAQSSTFLTASSSGVLAKVPIGYASGAGGSVVQATSKSTGVTLNAPSGQITMNGAALASSTSVSFTLTNSQIGANDIVSLVIKSGASADTYSVNVDAVAGGSCRISVRNQSAASKSEAIVLGFAITKAVIA